jgi:hypothetical protein
MQQVVATIRRHGGYNMRVDFRENVTISGQLASDLPKLIESGAIDMGYLSSSYLAERVPALQRFDRPFPPGDRAATFADLDGPLGEQLGQAVAAATGFRWTTLSTKACFAPWGSSRSGSMSPTCRLPSNSAWSTRRKIR